MAERRRVTAVDFVGDDAKTIAHDAAKPGYREVAIVATQQAPRRDVRPSGQRTGLLTRRLRLPAAPVPPHIASAMDEDVGCRRGRLTSRAMTHFRNLLTSYVAV